jgi:hypothetical protein
LNEKISPEIALKRLENLLKDVKLLKTESYSVDSREKKNLLDTRIKSFIRAVFTDDEAKIKDYLPRARIRVSGQRNDFEGEHRQDLNRMENHLLGFKDELELILESKDDFNDDISSTDIPYAINKEGKYVNIKTTVPNDFYHELIELINKSYDYGIYPAVLIFSRKLLENLIIDILKKYYRNDIGKYYIRNQGRFLGFRNLLENFGEIIEDLKSLEPTLNKDIVRKIGSFKDTANSNAHSLVINVSKDEIDSYKDNLNYLVKLLIKIINDQS